MGQRRLRQANVPFILVAVVVVDPGLQVLLGGQVTVSNDGSNDR